MKWFQFDQNNSGGSFVVDDKLCHRLFIEAKSEGIANAIAEDMGVYFNGVRDGYDCDCCGDRWYRGEEIDLSSTKTVEEYAQELANQYGWTSPDARIFYDNGATVHIFTKKKV
jgi:hypothetical protein